MPSPMVRDLMVNFPSGAAVDCGSAADLDFSENVPFTLEGWFLLSSFGAQNVIVSRGTQYVLAVQSGRLTFQRDGDPTTLASQATITVGDEYHFAVSYDGQLLSMYIDGALDSSQASPNPSAAQPGASFQIGGSIEGYVESVRAWNYGMPAQDVADVMYTTPQPGPTLLLFADLSQMPALDGSGRNHPIVLQGGAQYALDTCGLYLAGGTQYAQAVGATAGASGAHTLEAWFNASGDTANGPIVSTDTGANSVALTISNALLTCQVGGQTVLMGRTSLVPGLWYHAALTYDGTTASLYLNGVAEAVAPVTMTWAMPSNTVSIGAAFPSGLPASYFVGYIQDVRLWTRALSAAEIASTLTVYPLGAAGLAGLFSVEVSPPSDLAGNFAVTFQNGASIGSTTQLLAATSQRPSGAIGAFPAIAQALSRDLSLFHLERGPVPVTVQCRFSAVPTDQELQTLVADAAPAFVGPHAAAHRESFARSIRAAAARHRAAPNSRVTRVQRRLVDGNVQLVYAEPGEPEQLLAELPADSEEILWLLELAFTAIVGAIRLWGLRIKVGPSARNIGYLIVNNPTAKASLLTMVANVSATTVIDFLGTLYNQGLLKTILLTLVDIGVFGLLWLLASLITKFFGVGWAAFAAALALTIYELAVVVANRPQTRKWLTLSMFQAGGGDSLLFQTNRQNGAGTTTTSMLIDAGKSNVYPTIKPLLPAKLDYVMVTHQDSDHIGGVVAMLQDANRPVVSRLLFNSPYVRYNVPPPPYAEPTADELAHSDDDYGLLSDGAPIIQSMRQASNLTYLAQQAGIPIQLTGQNTIVPMDYQPIVVVGPSDANIQTYYAAAQPQLAHPGAIDGGVVNRASIIHQVMSPVDAVSMLFTGDAWDNQTTPHLGSLHVDIRTAIGTYGPPNPPATASYTFLKVPHHGSQLSEDQNFYTNVLASNYLISGQTHGNPTLAALQWIIDANTAANRQFRIYATNNCNGITAILADPNRRPSVNRHYHLYVLAAGSNAMAFQIENGAITYPTAAQVQELDPWALVAPSTGQTAAGTGRAGSAPLSLPSPQLDGRNAAAASQGG